MTELIPWMLAVVAAAVAFGLYLRVRGATVEAASAQIDVEKLRGELAATREQLAKREAKQRRAADELQTLRRKLDKAKKRASQPSGGPGPAATRVTALESELEQARQARDGAREEAVALGAELARLRVEMKQAKAADDAPASSTVETPLLDNPAIATLQARAETADAERASARKELAEHARTVERLRGKLKTQEELYVSIRGELAAKKDRLRSQQEEIERLQALKAALVDAPVGSANEPMIGDPPE